MYTNTQTHKAPLILPTFFVHHWSFQPNSMCRTTQVVVGWGRMEEHSGHVWCWMPYEKVGWLNNPV